MNTDRILIVDDDQNLLDGMQNQFRKLFAIETALGGDAGLNILAERGPFAVVISDMRMPGMDGVRFLAQVSERWPDTVRVMLTGNADLDTAVAAVNEGSIFRFVSKPCPPDTMRRVLDAALHQHRLITAERELLEKTLKGSIKALIDILALANPAAFSRAMRIKHYVAQLAEILCLADTWRFEVAAMLSQTGYVTMPSETLERMLSGGTLSAIEQKMQEGHAESARALVAGIPRLEIVAEMIARQNESFNSVPEADLRLDDPASLGAEMLRAAAEFDVLTFSGARVAGAVETLSRKAGVYHPLILAALRKVNPPTFQKIIKLLKISELRGGMVLADDIRTKQKVLVVAKGQEMSDMLRRRLENFHAQGSIDEPISVYVSKVVIARENGA